MSNERETDLVEMIVVELRKRKEFLSGLRWPGKLVIHVNPNNPERPVEVEAQVRL